MQDVKRTFKKVGNKIIVRQRVDDAELNAREVSDNIKQLNDNVKSMSESIVKGEQQIVDIGEKIKTVKLQIPPVKESLKQLSKFKDWAEGVQVAAIKLFVEEHKDKVFNEVTAKYEFDSSMSESDNGVQKFHQYMHAIVTSPDLVKVASLSVIEVVVRERGFLVNPWK